MQPLVPAILLRIETGPCDPFTGRGPCRRPNSNLNPKFAMSNHETNPSTNPTEHGSRVIFVAEDDHRRLRALAAAMPRNGTSSEGPTLRDELERANVLPRESMPPGVVTVNSRVRFQETGTSEVEEYIITWPERADGGVKRISVLAPIGTALLGYRQGDEVAWPTPGGVRHLRILEVEPVSEESLADPNEDPVARLLASLR